ncbi:MAG TPA: DoxX family protein [Gemmatirosa sp.]|jgi:putative oxidoreductase|nr:DoxX family protein [Gemmatirosa sp.]
MTDRTLASWGPGWLPGATLSLLRAVTGALFMQHGVQKLFGLLVDPAKPWNGAPPMLSQFWIAGVLEVFGGALIVVGLLTRPVAFLLAGEMAVAYFQVHAPRHFFPIRNGGEPVVLFCFVFLHLLATGAGPYSLDALLRARRAPGAPARDPARDPERALRRPTA